MIDTSFLDLVLPKCIENDIISGSEFTEFCYNLDLLDDYGTPRSFLEKVEDDQVGVKKNIGKALKNTRDTTRAVGKAYVGVVDAKAGVIKTVFDLVMKAIGVIVKAISFICRNISRFINWISKIASKIAQIPGNLRNKIKGNIALYITAGDLEMLYNNSVISRIDTYLSTLEIVTQGEMWRTWLNRNPNAKTPIGKMKGDNDMQLCRNLDKIYTQLSNVKFSRTVVEMKDQNIVYTYFGNAKSIKFRDLSGTSHEGSYYEVLRQLLEDINKRKDRLEKLQNALNKKYNECMANQDFARKNAFAQSRITETIQQTSKVVSIIGNIVRYVSIDMKTMDDTINKLLKK